MKDLSNKSISTNTPQARTSKAGASQAAGSSPHKSGTSSYFYPGSRALAKERVTYTESQDQVQKLGAVREYLQKNLDKQPAFFIRTFGCQQNEADSEQIRSILETASYVEVDEAEGADLILVNTCSIRANADQRLFGYLGSLKQYCLDNPQVVLAVCGCLATQEIHRKRIVESYPQVRLIFGPGEIWRLPEMLLTALDTKKPAFYPPEPATIAETLPPKRTRRYRALISIMYGCDNCCSYCIVPFTRGRERSRSSLPILFEAMDAADQGIPEIMLLGQNVNSWGKTAARQAAYQKERKALAETYAKLTPEDLAVIDLSSYVDLAAYLAKHEKAIRAIYTLLSREGQSGREGQFDREDQPGREDQSDRQNPLPPQDPGFSEDEALWAKIQSILPPEDQASAGLRLPEDFASLMVTVAHLPGVYRVRFMSSNPFDFSPRLIRAIGEYPRIEGHVHLPLQSGSDRILEKMRRDHDLATYRKMIALLRAVRPGIAITTDLMVGFPGETDEDFEETYQAVHDLAFDGAFSFIYSPRKGTVAGAAPDQVPDEVAHERFNRLQALLDELSLAANLRHAKALEKEGVDLLLEGPSTGDPQVLTGRDTAFKLYNASLDQEVLGKALEHLGLGPAWTDLLMQDLFWVEGLRVKAEITKVKPYSLEARVLGMDLPGLARQILTFFPGPGGERLSCPRN